MSDTAVIDVRENDDDPDGTRVAEDPLDLIGGGGLMAGAVSTKP